MRRLEPLSRTRDPRVGYDFHGHVSPENADLQSGAGHVGADTVSCQVGADTYHDGSAAEGGDRMLAYRGLEDGITVSAVGFGLVAGVDLEADDRYEANASGTAVGTWGSSSMTSTTPPFGGRRMRRTR